MGAKVFRDTATGNTSHGLWRHAEDRVHYLRSLAVHRGRHVAIDVERDRDGRVPEHLRDDLGMNAAAQEQGCCGVSSVVESGGPARPRGVVASASMSFSPIVA